VLAWKASTISLGTHIVTVAIGERLAKAEIEISLFDFVLSFVPFLYGSIISLSPSEVENFEGKTTKQIGFEPSQLVFLDQQAV